MMRVVVPCSGIGKAFGTVSREAAYQLTEQMHPDKFRTVCLALVMAGDEDAVRLVKESDVFTIDGCPKKCATVCVRSVGGNVVSEIVVPKVLAENKEHRPNTLLDIGEGGILLARDIVSQILKEVD